MSNSYLRRGAARRIHVENPQDAFVAGGCQFRPVRGEVHRLHDVLVDELVNLVPRDRVPKPRGEIRGRCCYVFFSTKSRRGGGLCVCVCLCGGRKEDSGGKQERVSTIVIDSVVRTRATI